MAERNLTCRRCNKQFKHDAPNKLYCAACCRTNEKRAKAKGLEEREIFRLDSTSRRLVLTGEELRGILNKFTKQELIEEIIKLRLYFQDNFVGESVLQNCSLAHETQELITDLTINSNTNSSTPRASTFGGCSIFSYGNVSWTINSNETQSTSGNYSFTSKAEEKNGDRQPDKTSEKKENKPLSNFLIIPFVGEKESTSATVTGFSFTASQNDEKKTNSTPTFSFSTKQEAKNRNITETKANSFSFPSFATKKECDPLSLSSSFGIELPKERVKQEKKKENNDTTSLVFTSSTKNESDSFPTNEYVFMLPEVNPEKKLTSETLPTTVKIGDIIQKAHKELDFQNTSKDSQINDAKQNRASTITPMSTFKVCIVGDGGVGKTTFVGKLNNGSFERKYIPTIGVDVKTLRIETNAGSVLVNMWDVAGQEKFGILRTSYYTKTDALILMFDVTSRMTYKNIPNWHAEVTKENPDVLCVILGNKVDLAERQVKPRTITFHRKKNIQYYELSVKSNYNIHKPLTYLLQRLTKNSELVLLENHPAKVEEFVETSDDVKSSCDQQ